MLEAERVIPDARHEPTDIGPGFIWGAAAVCLGTLLACALLVLWLYPTRGSTVPSRCRFRAIRNRVFSPIPERTCTASMRGDASPQRHGLGR